MNSYWEYLSRMSEKLIKKRIHEYPPNKIMRESLEKGAFEQLKRLITKNCSEKEIHSFLDTNRMIFGYLLQTYYTGNHGFDIRSEQEIIPHIKNNNRGQIPDFIIGGENSDGWQWWVIELKGPNDKFFCEKEPYHFSYIANCGICQLLSYISMSNKIQSHLRDQFRMKDFSNPKGILIIGREDELKANPQKQNIRAAFNAQMSKQFEIRTYDWFLRELEKVIQFP